MASRLHCPAALRAHLLSGRAPLIVTGAGGWLGRATLEMLDDALAEKLPERVSAYARTARTYRLRSGRTLAIEPLAALADLDRSGASGTLAHYAFLTRDRVAEGPLDAYVEANRAITTFVHAQARRLGVAGVFSTSSGAVYRADGSLDDDLARNPYGVLKGEEERLLGSLRGEVGAACAVCRVFNLSGPFINKTYALSSFIGAVLGGRDIRVEARGRVVRSYVHVGDLVAIGLACATGLVPAPVTPFDGAGDEAVEMGELAQRVGAALGRRDLAILRDRCEDAPDDVYVGDGATFAALAARLGLRPMDLDRQIVETAEYLAGPDGPALATGTRR